MKVSKIIPKLEAEIKRKEAESGPDTVCSVCTLHEVFSKEYDALLGDTIETIAEKYFEDDGFIVPLCPKCDKPLFPGTDYGYTCGVVGGSNTVSEEEDLQYCQLWHCKECNQDYAMMPEPIDWNANHDILYTGGSNYLTDDDEELLLSKIGDRLSASVEQFVRRVKDPKDSIDESLSSWNLNLWMERDITGAVAEFLYEKGFKK